MERGPFLLSGSLCGHSPFLHGTVSADFSAQRQTLNTEQVVAKRLVWGRCFNAGQSCVAPD